MLFVVMNGMTNVIGFVTVTVTMHPGDSSVSEPHVPLGWFFHVDGGAVHEGVTAAGEASPGTTDLTYV